MLAVELKSFVKDYWDAISGKTKTPELLEQYVSDPELIAHCLGYEESFPKFELIADDFISEDNKVVVRDHFKGKHLGHLMGMPPTGRSIEVPMCVVFEVADNKITKCYLYLDQMEMVDQLGLNNFN